MMVFDAVVLALEIFGAQVHQRNAVNLCIQTAHMTRGDVNKLKT